MVRVPDPERGKPRDPYHPKAERTLTVFNLRERQYRARFTPFGVALISLDRAEKPQCREAPPTIPEAQGPNVWVPALSNKGWAEHKLESKAV